MTEKKKPSEAITIIGQASGFKNLRIEGGFRLTIDLYESRDQDIAMCALLVNKRANLKLTIEPVGEKKECQQKAG